MYTKVLIIQTVPHPVSVSTPSQSNMTYNGVFQMSVLRTDNNYVTLTRLPVNMLCTQMHLLIFQRADKGTVGAFLSVTPNNSDMKLMLMTLTREFCQTSENLLTKDWINGSVSPKTKHNDPSNIYKCNDQYFTSCYVPSIHPLKFKIWVKTFQTSTWHV